MKTLAFSFTSFLIFNFFMVNHCNASNEPALHQAIIEGDLNKFKRNLKSPYIKGYLPAGISPLARILSREVQNSVPRPTRVAMFQALKKQGVKINYGEDSHVYLYSPPEVFKDYLFSVRQNAENFKTDTTMLKPAIELAERSGISSRVFDTHVAYDCNALGFAMMSFLTAKAGTNSYQESKKNLEFLLQHLDIAKHENSKTSKENPLLSAMELGQEAIRLKKIRQGLIGDFLIPYDESNVCDLSYSSVSELSVHDVFFFFGTFYGGEENITDMLSLLKSYGLFDSSKYLASRQRVAGLFRSVNDNRKIARTRAKVRNSITISKHEPAIHKAILRGSIKDVRKYIKSVNQNGFRPQGINALYRVFTPEVQNSVKPSTQEKIAHLIWDRIDTNKVGLNQLQVLVAAYGSYDFFVGILSNKWIDGLTNEYTFRPIDKPQKVFSVQMGSEFSEKFFTTETQCTLLMHIYNSIINAPRYSHQFAEGMKKLEMLLYGFTELTAYSGSTPYKPDSHLLANPMRGCASFHDMRNPFYPEKIQLTFSSFYSALSRDLNNPQRRKNAVQIAKLFHQSGRFNETNAKRSLQEVERVTANATAWRKSEAAKKASREAFDRRREQETFDSILSGIEAAANDISQQVANSEEMKQKRANDAAAKIYSRKLAAGDYSANSTADLNLYLKAAEAPVIEDIPETRVDRSVRLTLPKMKPMEKEDFTYFCGRWHEFICKTGDVVVRKVSSCESNCAAAGAARN